MELPEGAVTISFSHRVGFHETDAMGIVHHSNYLKFCENARVCWLETHDKSYADWMEMGLHFAVTKVDLDYKLPAKFDDRIEVVTWLEWVRGASLAMAYRIERDGTLLVTGRTEHASINDDGKVRRLPKEDRERMGKFATSPGR